MKSRKAKRRTIMAGVMAVSVLCSNSVMLSGLTVSAAPSVSLLGDATVDGVVDASDVQMLQEYLVRESTTMSEQGAVNAEMTNDQALDAFDLAAMKRSVLAGAETTDITYIHLQDTYITVEGNNATLSQNNTVVTITASGSYYIDGTLSNGQIIVNVADTTTDSETVKLFLNGMSITGTSACPILIENAENTSLNLVAGTTNYIYDGATYTDNLAAICAKDDMTIKGEGALVINADTQYAIDCNNDLKITGGTVTVTTALEDAIRANDTIEIKGGSVNIDCEGDGIKSTQGNVIISDGTVSVKAGNDAIQAETTIDISGGTVVVCGDRGLTSLIGTNITGGNVCATATDNQMEGVTASQGTMLLSYAAEWTKGNEISVRSGSTVVATATPIKKFDYVLISNSAISASASYSLYTGGAQMKHDGSATGTFQMTAASTAFTGVATLDGSDPIETTEAGIYLNGTSLTASGDGVTQTSSTIATITAPGEYNVYGEMTGGQIVVNVDKTAYPEGEVDIILNGISLTNTSDSPIYIASIDGECSVTAKSGTTNTISDGSNYTNADSDSGAIYSMDDLKIKGQGTLTVNGNCADGIVSKDDLKIWNGTITVNAVDDCLRGKDSVKIGDPDDTDYSTLKLTVKSTSGDGIKSTETDTTSGKGFVTITGGTINVTANSDGVHAAQLLDVNGGALTVVTNGSSSNTDASSKGLKAGCTDDTTSTVIEGTINVNGGTINVTSNDDCVHATDVNIKGGAMTLSSGDDGVHADDVLTLGTSGGSNSDFTINVTKSYEGIEAYDIEILSGSTAVVASDDGFNAAGGSDSSGTTSPGGWGQGGMSTSSGVINMSGGYIYSRASGDGFDSNGNINMTGGTLLVCGPTSGGNGIFDYGDSGCSFSQTGGIIFGMGTSDMAVYPSSSYVSASGTLSANSVIAVADSSGNALAALTVPSDMNMSGLVVFSNTSATSSTYSVYSGVTYNGTLDAHGYGVGGTISGGTQLTAGGGSTGGQTPWG